MFILVAITSSSGSTLSLSLKGLLDPCSFLLQQTAEHGFPSCLIIEMDVRSGAAASFGFPARGLKAFLRSLSFPTFMHRVTGCVAAAVNMIAANNVKRLLFSHKMGI